MTTHAAELEGTGSDAAACKEGTTNVMKDENALQKDEIVLENGRLHSLNVGVTQNRNCLLDQLLLTLSMQLHPRFSSLSKHRMNLPWP
mmetsp:Transcript_6294/g.8967  ORF Transcript_6294/g.8967 Transcript_6294/m.8967 type:complete len:88 (-) Transcript_6294:2427-2690(-)